MLTSGCVTTARALAFIRHLASAKKGTYRWEAVAHVVSPAIDDIYSGEPNAHPAPKVSKKALFETGYRSHPRPRKTSGKTDAKLKEERVVFAASRKRWAAKLESSRQ